MSPTGRWTYQLFRPERGRHQPGCRDQLRSDCVHGEGRAASCGTRRSRRSTRSSSRTTRARTSTPERQAEWEGRDMRPLPGWKASFRSTLAEADQYPDTKGGRVYPAKPLAGSGRQRRISTTVGRKHVGPAYTARDATEDVHTRQSRARHQDSRLPIDARRTVRGSVVRIRHDEGWQHKCRACYGMQLSDDDKWALIEYLKHSETGRPNKAAPSVVHGIMSIVNECETTVKHFAHLSRHHVIATRYSITVDPSLRLSDEGRK